MQENILERIKNREEVYWKNPAYKEEEPSQRKQELTMEDILDASGRLERFAPLISRLFPETESTGGIIESPIREMKELRKALNEKEGAGIRGRLFMKMDSDLAVAGSVKARGGIYEVLKAAEDLALQYGLLTGTNDDYTKLATEKARSVFAEHKMQVGSTGNLGLSIGIMSAALGYQAIVHMSADAKRWKKDLLRSRGVTVVEYEGDYSEAVRQGRTLSDRDPSSYFVDDENSRHLFLGYSVAALRLKQQLEKLNILIDRDHPMTVYIPCGVGGAPGGICFGLKSVWKDAVNVYFGEPVEAPSMLLGLASGKYNGICVQDIGLSGKTIADGLACGRPSGFAGQVIEPMLSGCFTVNDDRLLPYLKLLHETEDVFIEPSSCTVLHGPVMRKTQPGSDGITVLWATGGSLMPQEEREELLQ